MYSMTCPFLTNRRAVGGLAIELIEQRGVLVAEDHKHALNSTGNFRVEFLHRLLHGEDAEIVLAILVNRAIEAIEEAVTVRARPFMGICIGMQMLASWGREYRDTPGFGWIAGEVVRIAPSDPAMKVPHMGWNDLVIDHPHPVLDGIATGDHAYFVHSYHFRVDDPAHRLAHVDYGGDITAIVGRDNVVGTQFHPEKSQAVGLRIISNFLTWRP